MVTNCSIDGPTLFSSPRGLTSNLRLALQIVAGVGDTSMTPAATRRHPPGRSARRAPGSPQFHLQLVRAVGVISSSRLQSGTAIPLLGCRLRDDMCGVSAPT